MMANILQYLYYILGSIAAGVGVWQFVLWYRGRRRKELPALGGILIEKPLSWEEVYRGVAQLSEKIGESYKPDFIIGISSGGAIVGGMLSRLMDVPLTQITRSNPRLQETKPESSEILTFKTEILVGKKLLLVDDVIRSGWTLSTCYEHIGSYSPSGIKSAVLMLAGEHVREPDFYVYRAKAIDLRMPWDYHKVTR